MQYLSGRRGRRPLQPPPYILWKQKREEQAPPLHGCRMFLRAPNGRFVSSPYDGTIYFVRSRGRLLCRKSARRVQEAAPYNGCRISLRYRSPSAFSLRRRWRRSRRMRLFIFLPKAPSLSRSDDFILSKADFITGRRGRRPPQGSHKV